MAPPKGKGKGLIGLAGGAAASMLTDDILQLTENFSNLVPGVREVNTLFKDLNTEAQTLYNNFAKNVTTVETYRISLTKASGAGSELLKNIREQTYELNAYGIGLDKVVAANVAMAESYSRATFSSAQTRENFKEERKAMQDLITVNDKFGVSTDTTIKLANQLNNSVFTSTKEFSVFSDTLLKFSRETGQPFNKVMEAFGTYTDRFVTAISSDKAVQSFTTLELLARRAGMSFDKLVGSISKFDDIDEAFTTGGQLNRILSYFGGSLDTMAMANASEEEQAKMLLESISGISEQFNQQMTDPKAKRAVLKELAAATGYDVPQLMGLLNKNNSLAQDMQSIIRTPVTTRMEEIPADQKKKMAMDLTTQAEVGKIAQENMYIGPLTMAMEKFQSNQKYMAIDVSRKVAASVDKGFNVLLKSGDVPGMLSHFSNAISSATKVFTESGGFAQFSAAFQRGGIGEAVSSAKTTIMTKTKELEGDAPLKVYERHITKQYELEKARREEDTRKVHEAASKGVKEGYLEAAKAHKPQKVDVSVKVKAEKGTTASYNLTEEV